jgi:rhodanese-related sulfurtransferase
MFRRSLLPLLSLAALLGSSAARADEEFRLMPMAEVEQRLGSKGFAVFDANVPEIWQQHHVPGAVHIVGKDLAKLLPADRSAQLVFYCTNPK